MCGPGLLIRQPHGNARRCVDDGRSASWAVCQALAGRPAMRSVTTSRAVTLALAAVAVPLVAALLRKRLASSAIQFRFCSR